MKLEERLRQALDSAGEKWSDADRERAVRVMADLIELHEQAALGANVAGSQQLTVATIAQIASTSSRQARSIVRGIVDDVIGQATRAVTQGLGG